MGQDAEDSRRRIQLSIWMEEYKALSSDIQSRVDLQHRNTNLNIVFISALTGYIFNYWNKNSYHALLSSEIATLFVIAPLISLVFVWRHIDYDSNIIDKADYIYSVIRPHVDLCAGRSDYLAFESFLRKRRMQRTWKVGIFSILGNDHVIILLYLAMYMAYAWYMRIAVPNRAGEAKIVFDVFLYVGSFFLVVSVYMAVITAVRYAQLGKPVPGSSLVLLVPKDVLTRSS